MLLLNTKRHNDLYTRRVLIHLHDANLVSTQLETEQGLERHIGVYSSSFTPICVNLQLFGVL